MNPEYNEQISGTYVISNILQRTSSNGRHFMTATLSDRNGPLSAFIGDQVAVPEDLTDFHIVSVEGTMGEYRKKSQLMVDEIRIVDVETEDVSFAEIIPAAPLNIGEQMMYIWKVIYQMSDVTCHTICATIMDKFGARFLTIPAAKSIHHAFDGGLLMHVTDMLRNAETIYATYTGHSGRENMIDRDLLYAGVLLHDIGKLVEFDCGAYGLVVEYSTEGRLFGHSVLGAKLVHDTAIEAELDMNQIALLEHMILSHHGKVEYGAAVEPQTLEAMLLAYLDGMDSKIESSIEALIRAKEGSFTEKLFALGGKQIYKHKIA